MKRRDFLKGLGLVPIGIKALLDDAIEEQSETSIEEGEPNEEPEIPSYLQVQTSGSSSNFGESSASSAIAIWNLPLSPENIPEDQQFVYEGVIITTRLKDDEWSGS